MHGDKVHLVGDSPVLGNWSPGHAVPMHTCADTFPTWVSDPISLPGGVRIDYKFLIQHESHTGKHNHDGTVLWEELPHHANRSVVVPASCPNVNATTVVASTWNELEADKAAADEVATEKAAEDKAEVVRHTLSATPQFYALADSEDEMPCKAIAEKPAAENDAAEKAIAEKAIADKMAAEKATIEEAVADKATAKDSVTEKAVAGYIASRDVTKKGEESSVCNAADDAAESALAHHTDDTNVVTKEIGFLQNITDESAASEQPPVDIIANDKPKEDVPENTDGVTKKLFVPHTLADEENCEEACKDSAESIATCTDGGSIALGLVGSAFAAGCAVFNNYKFEGLVGSAFAAGCKACEWIRA